ncbi:CALMODULIN-BINDING PROTEIN60 [Arabidopsis thaliana x Arabidopsis arenosa]|uniref:CALMODULIN-BINDING PROTEIN60 n=1 Tax=Arabidopsis thaliana x Arabidopsis arenosa TaxID=1240361 RepID=A0A8T2BN40_9BRAS|nr:CALMODULIN-BINDING PROTEIN60 [Arabidopsis thaliana x Arabidopsis arenosa]
MAGKRLFQDLDSDQENKSENRITSVPSLASVFGALITENNLKTFSSALEPVFRKVVRQEVEYGISKRFRYSRSSSFRIEAPEESTPTFKLMFRKSLSTPIFTGSKISDVDNNPLEIILVDDSNNPVNLDRSIKLDIVALHGDFPSGDKWTSDEFESNIVKERDGKRPLLAGEVSVTVRNGVATIGELEFTDNSSWIRSRKFRIGAKVAKGSSGQGVAVCEAMTEAILVRDHRGELYKKHHPPMLEDEVWRLEKIGKDGAFHKKLSSKQINTVQDFLKLSVVDVDELRQILGPGMSDRKWEVTLKHARECILGNKLYISRGPNFFMILNPICEVMKALIDGHVLSSQESLNQPYVKNLVRDAYSKGNLLEVGEGTANEAALLTQGDNLDQQYLAGHYDNIEINRASHQNGYLQERTTNNLEIVNEGYITTQAEFNICFTGSSSQNHINPF